MKRTKERGRLRYLRPGYLRKEIQRFGYHFSPYRYAGYFLGLYGCVACLSYAFKLKLPFIVVICGITACFVPGMFAMVYRSQYEAKRFEDITAYMEQMLYSFKRHAKIVNSLEDTLVLFERGESRLYDAVFEAISYIQNEMAQDNLYREAFAIIEKEFGCPRLYKIHDFFIEAESAGGDFTMSADILLKDRRLWIDRVYEMQREEKAIKVKVTIGIMLSFLVCGMTVYMLPDQFGITEHILSQAVTMMTVLLNLLIWYAAQAKLSAGLMKNENMPGYEEVKRQYDYVMHKDLRKETKRMCVPGVLSALLAVILGKRGNLTVTGILLIYSAILVTQPRRRYRVSMKHVVREVEKVFPDWLMSMSLCLQTDNVHVSLAKSAAYAPEILREELALLLERVEDAPDSIRPYLYFMDKINLPDITSAMKVLYSMAAFGMTDVSRQIGPLVERSLTMTDKAERLKAEDHLAGVSFLVLLPMVTGVIKMLADLGLVMSYILAAVSNIA